MKYTVLVQRPDYASDNYGLDTYLAHVEAPTVEGAQAQARQDALRADIGPDEDLQEELERALDYAVLAVFKGRLEDIKQED